MVFGKCPFRLSVQSSSAYHWTDLVEIEIDFFQIWYERYLKSPSTDV